MLKTLRKAKKGIGFNEVNVIAATYAFLLGSGVLLAFLSISIGILDKTMLPSMVVVFVFSIIVIGFARRYRKTIERIKQIDFEQPKHTQDRLD